MRTLERKLKRVAATILAGLSSERKLDPKDVDTNSIKSILLVKRHELGDFLLFTPVLPAVRKRFPDARMVVCTRGYTKDVVGGDPIVDGVVVINEKLGDWKLRDVSGGLTSFIPRFDMAVVFNVVDHSLTSDLILLLSRARYRVGPKEPRLHGMNWNPFYNVEVSLPSDRIHMSERHLSIVEPFGIPVDNARERMYVSRGMEERASEVLGSWGMKKDDAIFLLHPGGARAHTRWPLERFTSLGDRFSLLPNARVVIAAGKGETWGEEVAKGMKVEPIVCKITDIRLLAAVFKRAKVYVGNDTGLLHLAAAVGTKAVGIYGKMDPNVWKPKGTHVKAVRSNESDVNSIEMEDVYSTAVGML